MSGETKTWDQLPNEPLQWYRRFTIYRLLEPSREMVLAYRAEHPNDTRRYAPTNWYEIAKKWRWEERCAAWDVYQDEQTEQFIAKEKAKIIKKHFALMHKRVEALNELAELLHEEVFDETKRWLPDVKGVGTGENFERVNLIKFNGDLISEYRATFADLAAELGHRIKKSQTAISLPANLYVGIGPDDDGSEE